MARYTPRLSASLSHQDVAEVSLPVEQTIDHNNFTLAMLIKAVQKEEGYPKGTGFQLSFQMMDRDKVRDAPRYYTPPFWGPLGLLALFRSFRSITESEQFHLKGRG